MSAAPVQPLHQPLPTSGQQAAADLLAAAAEMLADAAASPAPAQRYSRAYVAALRTAAAVVAVSAHGGAVDSRPRSVWTLMARLTPELGEWAEFFALLAGRRIAAEAGVPGAVNQRQADDLVRDAATFLSQAVAAVQRRTTTPVPLIVPVADRLG